MRRREDEKAGPEIAAQKIKAEIFIVNVLYRYILLARMNEDQKEEVSQDGVIGQRLQVTKTPGYEAAFDPNETERIAFVEDALSEQDARDSVIDL